MIRFAMLLVGISLTTWASAQDAKKWEPPAPPEGWKGVTSKDGRYYFAIPKDTARTGTRDRSFSTRGIKTVIQINYATLNDGTTLEVRGSALTGSELKGMSTNQVLGSFIDNEKEDGFQVSGPKEITIGNIKAPEYRLSKGQVSRRLVIFAVKPRVFELDVAANDAGKLDTEVANTFLKSFGLVPDEVVKAAAKERSEKMAEAGKESLAKYGAKWTSNLKEMNPPDAPVVGMLRGNEFKPDSVTLDSAGNLVFRKGTGFFPDMEVKLWLILNANESIENKTYEVGKGVKPPKTPHVTVSVMPKGAKVPKTESFLANYSLRLTFGSKEKDGSIPGMIYLCTPDTGRSWVAGQLTAKPK